MDYRFFTLTAFSLAIGILVGEARSPLRLKAQGFTQKLECVNNNKDPPAHYHYEATKYFQGSALYATHQLDAN
jgi:hypothetical protein